MLNEEEKTIFLLCTPMSMEQRPWCSTEYYEANSLYKHTKWSRKKITTTKIKKEPENIM